jgi:hypothetical protein
MEPAEEERLAEDPDGALRPFKSRLDLEALAIEYGIEFADDFDALLGDFWPEDEGADEFASALRTYLCGSLVSLGEISCPDPRSA